MNKPDLKKLSPVTYQTIHQYEHYNPTAFDESLTLLQKVNKMVFEMNKIGQVTNGFVEMWNDLIDWISGEGLEGLVEVILDDWYKNGKFDDFFSQVIEEIKMLRNSSFMGNIIFDKYHYRPSNDSHTSYWITEIPANNTDGTKNILKRGFAHDTPNTGAEVPRDFSYRKLASFVSNASVYDTTTNMLQGIQIADGKIVSAEPTNTYRWYLGIDKQGKLHTYPNGTSTTQMLNDGMNHVLTGFYPVIVNGSKVSKSVWDGQGQSAYDPHPRHVIAQRNNGDYVFLTSSGRLRKEIEHGLNMDDIYAILTKHYNDIRIAYVLDGGGSSANVVYGTMINRPDDGSQTTERAVPDFLYFASNILSPRDYDIYGAYRMIGYVRKELTNLESSNYYNRSMHQGYMELKAPSEAFKGWGIEVYDSLYNSRLAKLYIAPDNLQLYDDGTKNTIFRANPNGMILNNIPQGNNAEFATTITNLNDVNLKSGQYYAQATATGNPFSTGGCALQHWKMGSATSDRVCIQMAFSTAELKPKWRRYFSGAWDDWNEI